MNKHSFITTFCWHCANTLQRGDPRTVKVEIFRPLGYERVYLPLYEVADTPFHIQGNDL